ncbi:MAG: phosphoglucosamine mutase [Deltaproteobacteria bacterium]|nr:phosphoglucosamine mutase [Deltaproteobacteria bacterium]
MARLFGTDGIRGKTNQDPITPEKALEIGRSIVTCCHRKGLCPRIILGRDTRESGKMLEYGFLAGALSQGGEVYRVGEIPTPAVAYFTRAEGGGAGMVISASHNPYEDNGFKFFGSAGYKFSRAEEEEMEALISSTHNRSEGPDSGRAKRVEDAAERYAGFLAELLPAGNRFKGIGLVIDCANGATYKVAPLLFDRVGSGFEILFGEPDGKNINHNCGSQHPGPLRARVLESGASAGFAFDGDGDRLVAVDERGTVLTGDQLLAIFAKMLKDTGALKENRVVCTVMSNMGLRRALEQEGIEQVITGVGDRNVMETMVARKANLGGEGSGHIIFHDVHTTGDGLLSALQLLKAMVHFQRPLSELASWVTLFPQVIRNVPVRGKPELSTVPEIAGAVQAVESKLGERGRVLVRYSGTEPVCRIMVEGEDAADVETYAEEIAETVRRELS